MNHTFDGNDMNSNCAEKSGYNALSNDGNDDDKGMKKNLRRRNTARLDASSGNGSEQQQQAGNRSPINSASSVSSSTNPIKRQVDSSSLSPSSLVKQKVSIQRSDEFFSSSSSSEDGDDREHNEDSDHSLVASSLDPRHCGGSSEFDKAVRFGVGPSHSELPQQNYKARKSGGHKSRSNLSSRQRKNSASSKLSGSQFPPEHESSKEIADTNDDIDPLSFGVLPDALMTMRQKIEALTLFDSDMMKLVGGSHHHNDPAYWASVQEDPILQETRESLKRSSQQSISAAVLVSLAHKRYERRRLAAMEIEKVVRSLVQQGDEQLERVRAILLLLSDDYVRSTSEDARKGGVVALAASAIGLKKASDTNTVAHECRDLILASVVHACQDHSQRVRYYATESLFNVIKVIPSLAVQHFFILFEILRSLYADVDVDVKSGAELLDKKLKEVIVVAMNSGQFTAEACVPVFARFVYMRNKATKRLTLTWLQELTEKLIGAPILEFLHLFLTGIFDMIADPTQTIRQSALAFLQSVLPKLLDNHVVEEAIDNFRTAGIKVDFDKILQSLVTTMEHPDPFVRKTAMYWMSKIVKAHIGGDENRVCKVDEVAPARGSAADDIFKGFVDGSKFKKQLVDKRIVESGIHSAATLSVRNSLPHVLPGILLSIGDTFNSKSNIRDSFLPDTTTHTLADQTNTCLQDAVKKDGKAYVQHLDSFIVALREELDSPGGVNARNPPAIDRRPYRMDVKHDGTGIESQGWFRASSDTKDENVDSMMMSRLCALHWIIVLYESVVPDVLKADYAREFIIPIIHQLVNNPPEVIIFKSLEVLSKITIPVRGETIVERFSASNSLLGHATSPSWATQRFLNDDEEALYPMNDSSVKFALDILDKQRCLFRSRDRQVFSALIHLYGYNFHLIGDLSGVIAHMCRLQPPEFVFVSFAVELDHFVKRKRRIQQEQSEVWNHSASQDYQFVSAFIQQMCLVLLNSKETDVLRKVLKDCIGCGREVEERDRRRSRLFYILLHSFSHNLVAATSLCLWGGAFRSASLFLKKVDPIDISLIFLLEMDKLVEMIERPLFRHLHVRMLEKDKDPLAEGSGTMLFEVLKSLLMIIPQSTSYNVLHDRLVSTSRFRQTVIAKNSHDDEQNLSKETEIFVSRVVSVRRMHCRTVWESIRAESLESISTRCRTLGVISKVRSTKEEGTDRRQWLGYASVEEENEGRVRHIEGKQRARRQSKEIAFDQVGGSYKDFPAFESTNTKLVVNDDPAAILLNERHTSSIKSPVVKIEIERQNDSEWKDFWSKPSKSK